MMLVKQERPLQSFGADRGGAARCRASALACRWCCNSCTRGLVPRLPTAVLATGLVLAASLSFVCGLVLEQVARGRQGAEAPGLSVRSRRSAAANEHAASWRARAGAPDGSYDADVVILSLDRPQETEAAIRSALAQTGVSRHVFIVDQGSRAGDSGATRRRGCRAGRCHPGGARLATTASPAAAIAAPPLGHGRVIVGLDNDAEFADAHTLARAVAALDADPTLAAIGCRIVLHATGDG